MGSEMGGFPIEGLPQYEFWRSSLLDTGCQERGTDIPGDLTKAQCEDQNFPVEYGCYDIWVSFVMGP